MQLRDGLERLLTHARDRRAGRRRPPRRVLSEGERPIIRKLAVNLSGREVTTVEELDRALGEVRARVMVELSAGHKAGVGPWKPCL